MELRDNGAVRACLTALLALCAKQSAKAIFGVFADPLLAQIARTAEDIRARGACLEPGGGGGDYPCFASWNVSATVDDRPATSEHRQWLGIGRLNQDSCRWLNGA